MRPQPRTAAVCIWALLVVVAQLLSVQGAYFSSHPECGLDLRNFTRLDLTLPAGASSIGVCDYGVTTYSFTKPDRFAGRCLQCKLTPRQGPICTGGWKLTREEWHMVPLANCKWSQGCLDVPCGEGEVEAESAVCGADGRKARLCCPIRRYYLCCQALECQTSDSSSGSCVVQDKDLLPGQSVASVVFAVPAASGLCTSYAYTTERTCLETRRLSSGSFYEACSTQEPERDENGCAVLPGYTFVAGQVISDPAEAVFDDGTPWHKLPVTSRAAAALDPVLMAARCNRTPHCAAFDNLGSAELRSYVPVSSRWAPLDASAGNSTCSGTYIKQTELSSCPRIPGFTFVPGMTVAGAPDASSTGAGSNMEEEPWSAQGAPVVCSQCADSELLAEQCSGDAACAGFSNMHGLLQSPGGLAGRRTARFTSSPCKGMFIKNEGTWPWEVEALDKLFCGEDMYCPMPIQYEAALGGQDGEVAATATAAAAAEGDNATAAAAAAEGSTVAQPSAASAGANATLAIRVTLTASLLTPARLVTPNEATLEVMPSMPRVRRLHIRCARGATLVGALPRALLKLMPHLQELSVTGCGAVDVLSPEWAALAPPSLRVLDLSGNQLGGPLPLDWLGSSMQLSALNLSSNRLSGQLPEGWQGLVAPRAASAAGSGSHLQGAALGGEADDLVPPSSAWMVMDLRNNQLAGPLQRSLVSSACLDHHARIFFRSEGSSSSSSSASDAEEEGAGAELAEWEAPASPPSHPVVLLQGNADMEGWAGDYYYAQGKRFYSNGDRQDNMCGSYWYIVHIVVMWGTFVGAVAAISVWGVLRRRAFERQAQRVRAQRTAILRHLARRDLGQEGPMGYASHAHERPAAGAATAAGAVPVASVEQSERAARAAAKAAALGKAAAASAAGAAAAAGGTDSAHQTPREAEGGSAGPSPGSSLTASPAGSADHEPNQDEVLTLSPETDGVRKPAGPVAEGVEPDEATEVTAFNPLHEQLLQEDASEEGERVREAVTLNPVRGQRMLLGRSASSRDGAQEGPASAGGAGQEGADAGVSAINPLHHPEGELQQDAPHNKKAASAKGSRPGTPAAAAAASSGPQQQQEGQEAVSPASLAALSMQQDRGSEPGAVAVRSGSRWWRPQPGRWAAAAWSYMWVRRMVFLARMALLVADVATDIRVAVWLFEDGSRREAAVCVAFLALPQLVVALAIFGGLLAGVFSSLCSALFFGPLLLAVTPVLGPALALWNLVNPEVPLVFWRYLELVEFAVSITQAPAQSLTQTVVYARHSAMGGGMYIDKPLFVASIALSLADMAVVVYKMARHRKGPSARLAAAFSHLTLSSDPHSYSPLDEDGHGGSEEGSDRGSPNGRHSHPGTGPLHKSDIGYYEDLRPTASKQYNRGGVPHPVRGESYVPPDMVAGAGGGSMVGGSVRSVTSQVSRRPVTAAFGSPLQSGATDGGAGGGAAAGQEGVLVGGAEGGDRVSAGHHRSSRVSGYSALEMFGGSVSGPPHMSTGSFAGAGGPSGDRSGAGGGAGGGERSLARTSQGSEGSTMTSRSIYSTAASSAAWSARMLPPPPYAPNMLQQSSLRLAVSNAMDAITASLPSPSSGSRTAAGGYQPMTERDRTSGGSGRGGGAHAPLLIAIPTSPGTDLRSLASERSGDLSVTGAGPGRLPSLNVGATSTLGRPPLPRVGAPQMGNNGAPSGRMRPGRSPLGKRTGSGGFAAYGSYNPVFSPDPYEAGGVRGGSGSVSPREAGSSRDPSPTGASGSHAEAVAGLLRRANASAGGRVNGSFSALPHAPGSVGDGSEFYSLPQSTNHLTGTHTSMGSGYTTPGSQFSLMGPGGPSEGSMPTTPHGAQEAQQQQQQPSPGLGAKSPQSPGAAAAAAYASAQARGLHLKLPASPGLDTTPERGSGSPGTGPQPFQGLQAQQAVTHELQGGQAGGRDGAGGGLDSGGGSGSMAGPVAESTVVLSPHPSSQPQGSFSAASPFAHLRGPITLEGSPLPSPSLAPSMRLPVPAPQQQQSSGRALGSMPRPPPLDLPSSDSFSGAGSHGGAGPGLAGLAAQGSGQQGQSQGHSHSQSQGGLQQQGSSGSASGMGGASHATSAGGAGAGAGTGSAPASTRFAPMAPPGRARRLTFGTDGGGGSSGQPSPAAGQANNSFGQPSPAWSSGGESISLGRPGYMSDADGASSSGGNSARREP